MAHSNRVSARRTCACGRTFAKYQGLQIHERSCKVAIEKRDAALDQFERDFHSRYWERNRHRWPTVDTAETMAARYA